LNHISQPNYVARNRHTAHDRNATSKFNRLQLALAGDVRPRSGLVRDLGAHAAEDADVLHLRTLERPQGQISEEKPSRLDQYRRRACSQCHPMIDAMKRRIKHLKNRRKAHRKEIKELRAENAELRDDLSQARADAGIATAHRRCARGKHSRRHIYSRRAEPSRAVNDVAAEPPIFSTIGMTPMGSQATSMKRRTRVPFYLLPSQRIARMTADGEYDDESVASEDFWAPEPQEGLGTVTSHKYGRYHKYRRNSTMCDSAQHQQLKSTKQKPMSGSHAYAFPPLPHRRCTNE